MKVPFFANHLQYQNLKQEWNTRVERVWKSGQYFNGKEVQHLEERLASLCGRKYAVAVGSCSDALTISAQYYNLSRWAVSAFTFVASASSPLRAGTKIHLTSLHKNSFCPQVSEYSHSLKTHNDIEGLIHVDLFGSSQFSLAVEEYCKKNRLPLIEDAAQSFGSSDGHRLAGSFGDVSCLSFDPTKIISGTSAAGALLTDDFELVRFARSIRLHGKSEDGSFSQVGMKSLMSCAEAAIIDLKLNFLQEWIQRRNEIAQRYKEILQHESIETPLQTSDHTHSFHKFVIKVPAHTRAALRQHLADRGIETRVHYAQDLSQAPVFHDDRTSQDNPLKLHNNCEKVLSLPIYPEMSEKQVQHVGQSILSFFDDYKE